MAVDFSEADGPLTLRDRLKEETRGIIVEAFAACLSEMDVDKVTFADVAARAGVGERTVYRHFPTRDELMRALYAWLSRRTNPDGAFPRTEADLTTRLREFFTAFDAHAPAMRAAVITPQGYEMRQAMSGPRNAAFREAVADAAPELSDSDLLLAAAAIQHMHSAPAWLAFRDWGLSGEQAAQASAWAIRAMLADLKRRGGEPIGSE
jgi:AcrR family transcriptional regulator